MPLPSGFRWAFLTVAPQYDPSKPEDVSVSGLRNRVRGVRAAMRAIVKGSKGAKGVHAAFVSIEMSGTGHVHGHALIAAKWLDHEWLNRTASRAGGRAVFTWIETATVDTVREIAKYAAKLCSPLDEAALDGERRKLSAPALAAAWEVATYGARLHERYGALRRLEPPQAEEPQEINDGDTACRCCGTLGEWKWQLRPVRDWVRECRLRGVRALEGSIQLERRHGERKRRRRPRRRARWRRAVADR